MLEDKTFLKALFKINNLDLLKLLPNIRIEKKRIATPLCFISSNKILLIKSLEIQPKVFDCLNSKYN